MVESLRDLFVSIGLEGSKILKEIGNIDKAMDETKDTSESLAKSFDKIGKDVEESMTRIDKQYKLWELNATGMQKTLRGKGQEVDAVSRKMRLLDSAIDETSRSLEKSRQEFGKNSSQAEKLEDQLTDLKIKYAELNKELKGVPLTDQFKTLGGGMQNIGRGLTYGVTLPIIGLGVASTNTAIDIESAFAGVRKTVDGTAKQLEELKEELDDMATESIPIARVELYAIAEAAGQLGVKTNDIGEFTEVMAKLGVTTNLSSDEASTSLARFANITQMNMNNVDRLGSTIVDLGNNLATTESEITEMGLRLAGAGKQVNMTEAQIMSLAAGLSSVGVEAEAGGSALSRVMLDMQAAVMGNTKDLGRLAKVAGMSSRQFAQLFKNNSGEATIEFIEGLGRLKKEGANVAGVLDDLGFADIRLRTALLNASGAGDLFRHALELGNTAWRENNALNKEAAQRFGTTASQVQFFKSNIGDVAEDFGEILLPYLNDFLSKGRELANWLQNMDEGQRETIVKLGLFAAAIGPVLLGTGKMIGMFLTLSATVAQFGGIAALLASPLGWIPLAIGAIVIGGGLLIANWDKICEWANKLKDTVVGAFQKIGEFVTGIFGGGSASRDLNIGLNIAPALATGTRNWGGGAALIGEAGAELVTGPKFGNLPKGSNVYNNKDTEAILNRPMKGRTQNTYSDVFNPVINVTVTDGSRSEISKVRREVERQIEPAMEKYFYKLRVKRPRVVTAE